MSHLHWRTVTPSNSSQFLVKGTIIAAALYGPLSRFCIEEVRCRDEDGYPSTQYRVRDAALAYSLAPSAIVAHFNGYQECTDYCDAQMEKEHV